MGELIRHQIPYSLGFWYQRITVNGEILFETQSDNQEHVSCKIINVLATS